MPRLVRQLIAAVVILVIALFATNFLGDLISLPLIWAGASPGIRTLIGMALFQVLLVLELRRHTDSRLIWVNVLPIVGLIPYAWQRAGVTAWARAN